MNRGLLERNLFGIGDFWRDVLLRVRAVAATVTPRRFVCSGGGLGLDDAEPRTGLG